MTKNTHRVGMLIWSITTRWSVQTGVQFPK